jgi:hypothetical protein
MIHKALAASAALILASGMAVVSAAPALARPLAHEHISDSGSAIAQEENPNFCAGVVDFPVRHDWDVEAMFLFTQRGDGLAYAVNPIRRTDVWTNTLNDQSFTITRVEQEKDHSIIDNGDGTLTIVFSASGVEKAYGPDGTRLFMDTGTFRAEVLIDHGGTPADPFDDEFLEFVGVITDPGRADTEGRDFCEDLVTFIG